MDIENNSNDGIAKNKMGEEESEKESEDFKGKEISPGRDNVDQTEMKLSCSINNGDISLPHDDTSNSSSGATSDVQCNMCDSQFSTVYTLDSHFKQSHPSLLAGYMKKKYCHFCEIFLRSKQRLEQHLRVHRIAGFIIMGHTNELQTPNEVKPYKCNMCEYETHKNANLKRHVLAKHIALMKKPLKCDFCNFETVRGYVLQNHKKVVHMKEANIKCKYCGSTYIKYKTNIKHFKCDECSYGSAIKKKLIVHIKTKHSDEKPNKCNLCDFKTAVGKYLLTHMTKHRVAKCSQCEYQSTSKNDLIDHMKTHFGCHLCEKQFKAMFFLKRHLSTCHAKELLFKCSVCDYKTSSRSGLNRHKNIHKLQKVVRCDLCGYETVRKDALQRHLLACETREELRFRCTKCDFKSSLKNALNRHLKTHTQKKQLECDLCGYKTIKKKLLINHINIHSKEFNCKLCQFKTNERKSLIFHMHSHTSHTEKKLFQCNLCEYSTQFNSWLKRHILAHSRI